MAAPSTTVASMSSFFEAVKASFYSSVGDIVFGMEDGAVSIFGLVFGVAFSAPGSHVVLLAGATGAVAAAVSMMAGTYLDVTTAKGLARVRRAHEKHLIEQHTAEEAIELDQRLRAAGFTEVERDAVSAALKAHPDAWLAFESAVELKLGDQEDRNPWVQASWMFVADLLAAAIPVIPFIFLALGPARLVSVIITALLLIILGVGRARVAQSPLLLTIAETVGIAAAAAIAGLLVGKLVSL